MKLRDNYPDGNILWFNDFYLEEGKRLIFAAGNFNGLYEMSLKEKKLTLLGTFENENILEKQLYGEVYRYKDKLVFIPLSATSIAIYDLTDHSFESVVLPFPQMPCGFECKFLNAVIDGSRVFMFPGYASYIIEFDLISKRLVVHDEWYRQYIGKWGKKSNLLFSFDMIRIDHAVYLPSAQHNGLFKYNIRTNEYEFIDVLSEFNRMATLAYDGENFWCSTYDGKILKTDAYGRVSEQIDIFLTFGVKGDFVSSIFDEENLWLFSSQTSSVLRIRCNDFKNDYEIIKYSEIEKEYTSMEYHAVDFVRKKGKYIFFMSRSDRKLKLISKGHIEDYAGGIIDKTGHSEKSIDDTGYEQACMDHINKYCFYRKEYGKQALAERSAFPGSLDSFIKIVNEFNENRRKEHCLDNGSIIYEHCKR